MTERTKEKLGTLAAVVTVIVSVVILAAFYYGVTSIIWMLAIINLLSGPICLIMYLREAKKGIFSEQNIKEDLDS